MEVMMPCPHCGGQTPEKGNFCVKCGEKLRSTCDCPFLKKRFNCGNIQCPGLLIFVLEERRERDRLVTRYGNTEVVQTKDGITAQVLDQQKEER